MTAKVYEAIRNYEIAAEALKASTADAKDKSRVTLRESRELRKRIENASLIAEASEHDILDTQIKFNWTFRDNQVAANQ